MSILFQGSMRCRVCDAPASSSTRRDPFGKVDGWDHYDHYCDIHSPKFDLSNFTHKVEQTPHQNFWRCAHHPSAIDNFFEKRTTCEWDCHTTELKWFHNGEHPMPKSWGTPQRIGNQPTSAVPAAIRWPCLGRCIFEGW